MQQVEVRSVPLEKLAAMLPDERATRLEETAARAMAEFGDRTVWHVNATAHGGGVAEMLQTLLAYGRGARIENRWLVLDGDQEFFTLTKRLHNMLHGDAGDGGPLGDAERAHYVEVLDRNLAEMLNLVSPVDIVLLHDPQAAGLAEGLRRSGAHVVWRCHIGRDEPSDLSTTAWDFLRPFLEHVEAFVFSRLAYAPPWVDRSRLFVIPPSIDPYATKNRPLTDRQVTAILATVGLVTGAEIGDELRFERRDGSVGTLRTFGHEGGLVLDGPPPSVEDRLVVQVSRWDRLKDMTGVMTGFARMAAARPDGTHLMLTGPAVTGVADDPEGDQVLAECRQQWAALEPAVRRRVHLASIPLDDVDENAIIINALQRHASIVVQKSLVEGFGLTVTEAMWKGRPVVASKVGGIQDQIVDGVDGLLIEDPRDLDAFGVALARLLDEPGLAARLGEAARARVLNGFIGDRHLEQYADLFAWLVRQPDPSA